MRWSSKITLIVYLLILTWLVLFKFSINFSAVLDSQVRSLHLIPFAETTRNNLRETISNIIVFIPFGLLLSVNFKSVRLWQKLALIFLFSLVAEIFQFVLAIGVTDTTDLITNTLGGLLGLVIYNARSKYTDTEKQDRLIVITSAILCIVLILLRFFVFKVRYHVGH